MGEKVSLKCEVCGKQTEQDNNSPVPECCGKSMVILPVCIKSDTAEHARANDPGEPCDDGRSGQ